MSIEINGKVYRNLQEQVGKNQSDIEALEKQLPYNGPYDSTEDIPSDVLVNGGIYLIGASAPYAIYKYNEDDDEYTNLGNFGGTGPQGPQGPQGPAGIPGETGPEGETGNGISSITKTGTVDLVDTYTITMTDGSTYNFTVTNGKDGSDNIEAGYGITVNGDTIAVDQTVIALKTELNPFIKDNDTSYSAVFRGKGVWVKEEGAYTTTSYGDGGISRSLPHGQPGYTYTMPDKSGTFAMTDDIVTSYNDLTDKPSIPTKTSDLTNDSGFITSAALTSYVTTTMLDDALDDYALKTDLPENVSDLNNDAGYITNSDLSSALSTVYQPNVELSSMGYKVNPYYSGISYEYGDKRAVIVVEDLSAMGEPTIAVENHSKTLITPGKVCTLEETGLSGIELTLSHVKIIDEPNHNFTTLSQGKLMYEDWNGIRNFNLNSTRSSGDYTLAVLDDIPSLSGYATESWVENQGYLTSSALSDYVTLDTAQTITGSKTFQHALTVENTLYGISTTYTGGGRFVYNNNNQGTIERTLFDLPTGKTAGTEGQPTQYTIATLDDIPSVSDYVTSSELSSQLSNYAPLTTVTTLESLVSNHTTQINSINSNITDLQTLTSTHTSQISGINSSITSLESLVNTNTSNISTIQNNISTISSSITTLEGLTSTHTSQISALQTSVSNCVTLSQLSTTLSDYALKSEVPSYSLSTTSTPVLSSATLSQSYETLTFTYSDNTTASFNFLTTGTTLSTSTTNALDSATLTSN